MTGAVTAFAPGRVNLIGEHTDYNRGLALPFAIEEGVTVRASPRDDDRVHAVAVDLGAHDSFPVSDPGPARGWRAFVRGVVAELGRAGTRLPGVELRIAGTVPRGSGLSSSAALEVALCLALLGVAGEPAEQIERPRRIELARLCSRVENEWVGARTGLLDQLASLCARRGKALQIDFGSQSLSDVPLELGEWSLVTLDSGQRHANAPGREAADGYNRRREECAEACRRLGLGSLREAGPAMAAQLPWPLAGRVRHVISENERVRETVAALAEGDLERLGELLDASHASLRDDYEVSTQAVEAAIERLHEAGAAGARILGGGFGGHVLGLMPPGRRPPEDARTVAPGEGAQLRRAERRAG